MTLAEFNEAAARFWRMPVGDGLPAFLEQWADHPPAEREGFLAFVRATKMLLLLHYLIEERALDRIDDEEEMRLLLTMKAMDPFWGTTRTRRALLASVYRELSPEWEKRIAVGLDPMPPDPHGGTP